MRFSRVLLGVATALALTVTAASAQVVVSSKIDTEGGVLGNIILQVLQHADIPVTDKIQLGPTPIVREAIKTGQIDIYPEYSGNGAFLMEQPEGQDATVWSDAQKGYETAKKLDYDQNKIVWLTPASANNTWAIALRSDVAEPNNIVTLTDFGKFVAGGGNVKFVGSAEFVNEPYGLGAIEKAYGFDLTADQTVTLSGGDTAATIAAAAQQTNGVNAAMVYGTDGGIRPSGLTLLEDDKVVQGIYLPTPIIREEVLNQYPQIADLLKPVFEKLDLTTLQDLNGRVQVGGEAPAAVATDWLTTNGFLS
jgi:osmoprotectant transport system substrate-binding protein